MPKTNIEHTLTVYEITKAPVTLCSFASCWPLQATAAGGGSNEADKPALCGC